MKKTLLIFFIVLSLRLSNAQELYIVNSNSQTLSYVNIETMSVSNNFAQIGLYGNHIAFHKDKLYVVNSGDHNIQVIGLNETEHDFIYLENSSNPWHILIHNDFAYVTGMVTGKLYKVDLNNTKNILNIDVGTSPQGMLIIDDALYIALTGLNYPIYGQGKICVVDLNSFSIVKNIDVETNPQELIFDKRGYIHVLCTGNYAENISKVVIINSQSHEIEHIIDFPWSFFSTIQFGADGLVYIGSSYGLGFATYDPLTFEIINGFGNTLFNGGHLLLYDEQYIYVLEPSFYPNSFLNIYDHEHQFYHRFNIGLGSFAMVLIPKKTAVLGIPQNLTGELRIDSREWPPNVYMYLNWDTPVYENTTILGYNVFRNNIKINLQPIYPVHTFYSDGEFQDLETDFYEYHVIAEYVHGQSAPSNKFHIDLLNPIYGPPKHLEAVFHHENEAHIALEWQTPIHENTIILGYTIYRDDEFLDTMTTNKTTYNDYAISPNTTYTFHIIAHYYLNAVSEPSNTVQITTGDVTDKDIADLSNSIRLSQNYPNPFNPNTNIDFELQKQSHVVLDIFNFRGQKIKTLLNSNFDPGKHSVLWYGNDDNGVKVGSGLYFYRLQSNGYESTKKMILLK